MAVTSSRVIQVQFSGDVTTGIIQSALDNILSPGQMDLVSLVLGANVIAAPVIAGLAPTALTIIPPSGNVSLLILKGVAGDSGVALHLTDPTSIGLNSSFVSLVLSASVAVAGVRLVWS